ncbi:hypothetical protein D3C73_506460 [compost metagenome]
MEGPIAGEKRITVRPLDPGNALSLTQPVDLAAGSAIGIGEKDSLEPVLSGLGHGRFQPRNDLLRIGMPNRWQAVEVDMVEPLLPGNRKNFPCDRSARDHVNFFAS